MRPKILDIGVCIGVGQLLVGGCLVALHRQLLSGTRFMDGQFEELKKTTFENFGVSALKSSSSD